MAHHKTHGQYSIPVEVVELGSGLSWIAHAQNPRDLANLIAPHPDYKTRVIDTEYAWVQQVIKNVAESVA
jgi:hypothetical protein